MIKYTKKTKAKHVKIKLLKSMGKIFEAARDKRHNTNMEQKNENYH
jgi:hypothetical protein